MNALGSLRAAIFLASCVLAAAAVAQPRAQPARPFEPEIGQPGKDVIWVPTPQAAVDLMLDLARLGTDDFVIDLGSGDGRIVIAAAKRGARGFGVDLHPDMVALAAESARKEGVAGRARFEVRDLFQTDISQATVLTMYLLPELNVRLRPTILATMKPGSRVVSHSFHMGDWTPDAVRTVNGRTVHYWVVPARAMGAWRWENDAAGHDRPYQMQVAQRFQELSAVALTVSGSGRVRDLKLTGDRIGFTLFEEFGSTMVETVYEGRIEGDTITGTARTNGAKVPQRWFARRTAGGTDIEAR